MASGWSLVAAAATMLGAFGGFVIIANLVGTDRLGLLALVGAALFPLRFADLGLGGAVMRYVGAYRGGNPRRYARRVIVMGWLISLAAFAILLGISLIVAPPLLRTTIAPSLQGEARQLVPLLVIYAALLLIATPLNSALLGQQRFRTAYAAVAGAALLQLAAIAPLVMAFGIAGMVLAQIGAQVVLLAVYLAALARLPYDDAGDDAPFDRASFLRFSFQFSLNSLASTLVEPAAKLLFGSRAPLAMMGVFEVMWRIFWQLRTLLVSPLHPLGIAMIAQWQEGRDAVRRSYRLISALSLLTSFALVAMAPLVYLGFMLVTPAAPAGGLLVALGIATAFAFGFLTVPPYFLAMAADQVRPILVGTLVTLAILLLASWIFGGTGNWQAVILALVVAHAVACVVQFVLTARLLKVRAIPTGRDLREGFATIYRLASGQISRLRG